MKKSMMRRKVEQEILNSYRALYRLAYSYVQNEQDAMDIVQESACKAMAGIGKLKETDHVKTWLWRIVINTALDFIRKSKRAVTVEEMPEQWQTDTYVDLDLMSALGCLSRKEKTIIILKYFEEWKLSEIAEVLEENVNTVKTVLYRALKKLRVEIRQEEII